MCELLWNEPFREAISLSIEKLLDLTEENIFYSEDFVRYRCDSRIHISCHDDSTIFGNTNDYNSYVLNSQ